MPNWTDKLEPIIAEIEREAYKKGWDAALRHVVDIASNPAQPAQRSLPLVSEPLVNNALNGATIAQSSATLTMVDVVGQVVRHSPGLRGTDIVSAIHGVNRDKDRKAMDRTVRTALLRLRKKGAIVSRDGGWYPKEAA